MEKLKLGCSIYYVYIYLPRAIYQQAVIFELKKTPAFIPLSAILQVS